jgi:pimeloyl-ACP methyl ester carboxylesterase
MRINSRLDRLTQLGALLRVAFPLAQHAALDGLGHMGPITHPAAVNARIATFLSALQEELDLDESLKTVV